VFLAVISTTIPIATMKNVALKTCQLLSSVRIARVRLLDTCQKSNPHSTGSKHHPARLNLRK
jgi:hypothetical protein